MSSGKEHKAYPISPPPMAQNTKYADFDRNLRDDWMHVAVFKCKHRVMFQSVQAFREDD